MEQGKVKRSRRVLSLKERIEVIRIAETRRDTRALAAKFDCGRTQILSILSQKERLLREWANNGDPNRLRRRPSPIAITTNKVLYEWINRCKCAQLPITEKDILEKANVAKHVFKYNEFRPNRRWLERFKRKFKINLEELLTPNPAYYDGIERSLGIWDIYKEIKQSILANVGDDEVQIEMTPMPDSSECLSLENAYDQTMSSSTNDYCEIYDSDENLNSEDHNSEEDSKPITNNEQALACLKKLEEYSMLEDNYRAIGLIGQLEKIYMGQLET